MKAYILIFAILCTTACDRAVSARAQNPESSWTRQAQNVTIVRDNWGIPHVFGKTDADAVFGVTYAQAEDDFNRVETNYLNALGRLAEAEGENEIYRDLRMKLFIDPVDLEAKYRESPPWLQALMNAWADGLNYFLATHPSVKPRVITRFEPWMALSFSEGSIGGDIERVDIPALKSFYSGAPPPPAAQADRSPAFVEPSGSNGIAIGPSISASKHALLLINPHTSFFFRAEAQMVSDEGLNAYGAITWGQFFVYQGFNQRAGWMHTSSGVDNIDEYLETIIKKGNGLYYKYGSEERAVKTRTIRVPYKTPTGTASKEFTVYSTQHGPIVRASDGKWVSIRLMQDPMHALMQSYSRTKANSYKAFRDTMELHTNSSNNTVYADADGTIAYFHSNFIPRRETRFDWAKPVDGSDPATDWKGVLSIDETPGLLNPPNGWLYNSNNWPWSAAGANSPKKNDYPEYVDRGREESARGFHAVRVLQNAKDVTVESLRAAAYDSYLPWFDQNLPALVSAWDHAPRTNPLKLKLAEQIALLRKWDYRWSVDSVPTSLAVYWGEDVGRKGDKPSDDQRLQSLAAASDKLTSDFGTWKTPWGEINRFERVSGDIVQKFSDTAPSIPVGFTSSRWGSLASFGARTFTGTKKMYGTTGNSFVAIVEFGDRVRARAVTAGGESGDPASPHFNDQALRYSTGDLRDVYFYRSDLEGHTERQYHPGQ
ncbi:MAG TPA: acylase [Vicinamibacterales bacterium]